MEKYSAFRVRFSLFILNSAPSTVVSRILEQEYKCVYSSWRDYRLIGSLTVAFPDPRPTSRVRYGCEDNLSIFIRTRSHSNNRYHGYCCRLPRFCLRVLHDSGKWASTRLAIFSLAQRPIPPIHRAISYVLTALLSRLSLFVLGLWWIRVEEVSRKRGFVCVLSTEARC